MKFAFGLKNGHCIECAEIIEDDENSSYTLKTCKATANNITLQVDEIDLPYSEISWLGENNDSEQKG